MELVAENGCIVSISKGCKKELGRGSELAIHDKTVSRHQILLELQEQSKEARSVGHDTYFGLSVKVLGANPVCIVHAGQSTGSRSNGQEITLLKTGDIDTLFPGDKISLSLSLPMFLTVREGGGRKNINGSKINERGGSSTVLPMEEETPMNAECSKQVAEDELLGRWKNRKNEKKSGPCITHDTTHAEALDKRKILADEDVVINEEEAGIAQAVARRQKRAFERRQQQEQNRHEKRTGLMEELEDEPKVESEASKPEVFVNTENIDPVKEFGFLVEGSEFEQYKKRHKLDGGRWVWPLAAKTPAESGSDEDDQDQQERHRQSQKGKKKIDGDDEEWKGDDQEEKVAIASAKKLKGDAKVNLRSHEPSSSKKRDTAMKKRASGSMSKDQREEMEDEDEDEDEADETLGGFIVNDNEEDDPLDDSADDEEDEASDDEDIDEEMDEAEEEDEEDAKHNKSKKKSEEKPLCKYGKNCYRKNRDHLAQYRH